MRTVEVTYCGIPLSAVPTEYLQRNPGKRINYFEIPWCASCPGHGRLLVTSEQLTKIEGELQNSTKGYSDLILSITENGTVLEQIHLIGICLIAAHPVWGDTFTSGDKKNSTGLWELEVQDYRSIRLMSVLDNAGVNNNQLAVFNVKNKAGEWIDGTINGANPWTLKQLIENKCFYPFGISIDPALPAISTTPENLFLSALPAPLVADLLLAHHSCKMAIRYDPTADIYFRAYESIDNFAATIEHRKIFGGYSKLYPVGFPEKTIRYQRDIELADDAKTAAKPTCKNFLKTTLEATGDRPDGTVGIGKVVPGTVVPIYDRNNSMTPADSSYSRRKFPQFHGVYHGFVASAITSTAMIGLVRYDWNNSSEPFTEIHSGVQSPIRTALEGPCAHFLRDTPLRLSIDGDLSLPQLGGGSISHYVITNCVTGIAGVVKVKRSTAPGSSTAVTGAEEKLAWLGTDPFLGPNMPCWAIPFGGSISGTEIPLKIIDEIQGAGHWAAPTSGELATTQDNPTAATLCDG
jgi:hypothetical protein